MCLQLEDRNSCQLSSDGTCPTTCQLETRGACLLKDGSSPTNANFGKAVWFCAKGTLADGVTGYAMRNNSPRPFMMKDLTWAGNVWTHHYEFLKGLGSIPERFPTGTAAGFAQDYAWNLNPGDTNPGGTSKIKDYLAGLATKTATNRNGVWVKRLTTCVDDECRSEEGQD